MLNRFLLLFVSVALLGCNAPASDKADASLLPAQRAEAVKDDPTGSAYQMQGAATTFLASLSPELREPGMFALTDGDARTKWSNLPASMYERVGIRLGDLSDEQRRHFHNLLRASSSSQGYLKMSSLFWMEDILHEEAKARFERDGGSDFFARLIESWRSENYWASFYGDPATDDNWGWMITGHHLAASFTVVDNDVAFTPLFLGAEPYEVEAGTFAGWRALSHEVERGFELLHALSAAQQEQAVLDTEIPRDVLEGPGLKQSLETYQGIAGSELNAPQQKLLNHLIHEYVKNADHDAAERQLAKIAADGMDKLFFAWIGPTDDISKRYYYRVHGPSILIEYIRERGVGGDQGAANHVHTMVRDPQNDYGEDWLQTHYEEHHSGPGGPGGPGGPPPGGNN
ncbi:MAG: DUF3500 domain-containing protein [Bacteroidota bacterium]